jgi:two-component system, NtrC family, response regulator AtoC
MTARDNPTEDYDAYAQRVASPWCVSVSLAHSFVLQLPSRGRITFGRGAEADVRLVLPSISRLHMGLTVRGDQVELADLGSRNGTRVDGAPIGAPHVLQLGQQVSFGAARLQLVPESALPTGVRALQPPRALVAHVDQCLARSAVVSVWVVRLLAPFYESPALLARMFQLPAAFALGLVDERTLGLVAEGEEHTLEPARLAGDGVEASGRAVARSSGDRARGSSLLSAALRALSAPDMVASARAAAPQRLDDELERVARSAMSVLVVGETGVGKEVMARAIHDKSGRTGPLVSVNAAALPENLIESELFGHERGAFSGAERKKLGLVEAAHRGTLFLDEIGDLPLALQAKLLRVLEDKKVRALGATEERQVDVRVIAATHRKLDEEVKRGSFRQDLYFRLNACVVHVPPLRERLHELPALAQQLLERLVEEDKRARVPSLTAEASAALHGYAWPGNVRELKNALERALALADGGAYIELDHLPEHVRTGSASAAVPAGESSSGEVREELKGYERARIMAALQEAGGSVAQAADKLGLPRRTLAYRMARLGVRAK